MRSAFLLSDTTTNSSKSQRLKAGQESGRAQLETTTTVDNGGTNGIVNVLTESIAARGTSFRDYRDATGGKGDFERSLAVYGRGGEPCLRCGARLIESHVIDGRTTVLCAGCQR